MEMENVGFADVSVELSGASKLLLSGSADFLNVDAGGASSCKAASLVGQKAEKRTCGFRKGQGGRRGRDVLRHIFSPGAY